MRALFFRPSTEHPNSAEATHAEMPRETLPDAWVLNLSNHVEARSVSNGQTVAWMAIGLFASFALALALAPRAPW
jgi:hypothetical protein